MHDYFKYNEGYDQLPEGAFKVSPSRLSKFFDATSAWYDENLQGGEGFTGNTASHLGTVVHALAEAYVKEGQFLSDSLVEEYLDSIQDPEVDKDYIRMQYPIMAATLRDQFLCKNDFATTEAFIHKKIKKHVYAAGSTDALLVDHTLVDYKTTSALSAPTSISRNYWFQQMTYVWIYRHIGIPVNRFKLVYVTTNDVGRVSEKTGKPLKDYPTEVVELVHDVSSNDMEIIENCLKVVADSVIAWDEMPEIRHLLSQDYRNKQLLRSDVFKNRGK